jgi:hypothetical protein
MPAAPRRVVYAALVLVAGCHLALGLEPAAELEETTTAEPDCTDDGECDDGNACTDDACIEGVCDHVTLDGVAPANAMDTPEDCKVVLCLEGQIGQANDDDDVPVDDEPCTDDICTDGVPSNPPVAGGTPCATGVCNGQGECTECYSDSECTSPDTCGGGEEPWQCGCTPLTCTDVGLTCGNAPNGCVGALNCDTGTRDGDETDIDCGGSTSTCPRRCLDGEMCDVPGDCSSNVCTGGFCQGN